MGDDEFQYFDSDVKYGSFYSGYNCIDNKRIERVYKNWDSKNLDNNPDNDDESDIDENDNYKFRFGDIEFDHDEQYYMLNRHKIRKYNVKIYELMFEWQFELLFPIIPENWLSSFIRYEHFNPHMR